MTHGGLISRWRINPFLLAWCSDEISTRPLVTFNRSEYKNPTISLRENTVWRIAVSLRAKNGERLHVDATNSNTLREHTWVIDNYFIWPHTTTNTVGQGDYRNHIKIPSLTISSAQHIAFWWSLGTGPCLEEVQITVCVHEDNSHLWIWPARHGSQYCPSRD